jgi:uncharacterized membrane protein YedE/YeeE
MTDLRLALTAAVCIMGLAVGYLAQRSRMCFVAGFRDWLLVRDRELLLGFFSFVVTVWVLTTSLYSLGLLKKGAPEYGEPRTGGGTAAGEAAEQRDGSSGDAAGGPAGGPPGGPSPSGRRPSVRFLSAPFAPDRFMYLSLAGGWLVGLLSTFAGGCVLRQHVLAAQGGRDAAWYLAGFYAAVPAFYLLLERFLNSVY